MRSGVFFKLVFSISGRVQTPTDAFLDRFRRGLPKEAFSFFLCIPSTLKRIGSELYYRRFCILCLPYIQYLPWWPPIVPADVPPGNSRTIAPAGTIHTPHASTSSGCSHLRQAISQALQRRATRTLLNRRYRGTTTAVDPLPLSKPPPFCGACETSMGWSIQL